MNNQGVKKYSYYLSFTTQIFLGAKELLKSMPAFYNKIYFSTKYTRALWSGDVEETFVNVTILTQKENMAALRQMIKTNFLYIGEWDSIKYTQEGAEYGFSFIAGNVKYVLMPFVEAEAGYIIRSYDVDTGNCYETNLRCDKQRFLSSAVKENGEIVRVCDFNLEYMNDGNTTVLLAQKKAEIQNMATFTAKNDGYALISNIIVILLISVMSVAAVYISYCVASGSV